MVDSQIGIAPHATPLRAQISLCALIAFVFTWLSTYAQGEYQLLVLFFMAIICGTILDIPPNESVRKILVYCMPIQVSCVAGISTWYLVHNAGQYDNSVYFTSVGLSLAAYPMLIICCLARPAIVETGSQLFRFATAAKEAGFHLNLWTKIVVSMITTILAAGTTQFPMVAANVVKALKEAMQ